MIQLHSQHSLVVGRDGQRRSFSFDDVHSEVIRALRTCGSDETWIAEHVLLVVEEHIIRRRGRGDSIHEKDVDRLVSDVLVASGYKDVARAYEARRGLDPVEELTAALASWDSGRVYATLTDTLPLADSEAMRIAERVATALRALRYDHVSDILIRELGIHFLCGEGEPEKTGPDEDRSEFLVSAEVLSARTGLAGSVWDRTRAVRIRPVSRLFPRICVDVHLDALCASLGGGGLTELALLPAVRRLCDALSGMVREARACVGARRSDVLDVPSHLVVHGLGAVFDRCLLPMGKRARRECEREVREFFAVDVASVLEFEVILTFR